MENKKTSGIELIAEERQRQIENEGWTLEHDKEHNKGELAAAAACYALYDVTTEACCVSVEDGVNTDFGFPFDMKWWKPDEKNPIKNLVRAGALIAAEIDRLNAK